MEGLMDLGFK